ncbi:MULTISPECIES: DUF4257 domain-containing protein [unclassified Bacillus (in: firmicutes)]|uniref:DUF4257 domain-containing protein n=1 Tax=Bacillaceae TaxID=186817 RepID=UPI0015586FD3|nr:MULTISPECIES: DUF4257 domain-containing protein [unclassified Bacillus (in: firmicutes)]QKE75530.1 DUF4257 domain-containing protein [Arthrobacter citreus]
MVKLYVLAIVIGGVTGFIFHILFNKGTIMLPVRRKKGFYLGFLADILFGATASTLFVSLFIPENMLKDMRMVIGYCILAGLSSQSFLLSRALNTERERVSSLHNISKQIV